MTNLVQTGNRILYTNTGAAITSGSVVVLVSGSSGILGIAVTDIAATTGTGQVSLGGYPEGVFSLAKKSGDVFTALQAVYWDSANSRLTTSSSGTNTLAGRVTQAYASAATTANLILNRR